MHKRLVNHCTIKLTIIPDGPILIKSGQESANPTKPDMEFVETYHAGGRSIYLPGSSLKGAIRAHAERIVRTVGSDFSIDPKIRDCPIHSNKLWAGYPPNLNDYKYLNNVTSSQELYRWSSFTDRMFGNTAIASRVRIEDAHPVGQVRLEERNGVAIDRVFGSVAVGPFNYQVCTEGKFETKIHLKNFTLAQLGLIGLVLRDLNDGWFGLGFAKSRGLGTVQIKFNSAEVQYPGCVLKDGHIQNLANGESWESNDLRGVGEFLSNDECKAYDFPKPDKKQTTSATVAAMEFGLGVKLTWQEQDISKLFTLAVEQWREALEGQAAR